MSRRNPSKKRLRKHADQRLQERYGRKLTDSFYNKLKRKANTNDFLYCKHKRFREYIYLVIIDNQPYRFVVDSYSKRIVTFLPVQYKDRKILEKHLENNKE